MKYFYSSFIITILGLLLAYFIGGFLAVYICFLLGILEVSLSFDNAVVNAKILSGMNKKWQDRFIIFGIPIAVFGMRFLFPILIVSVAANLGMWETFSLALNDPDAYHNALSANKNQIYIFGGAFLLMVFLSFFFEEKDVKWIRFIEDNYLVHILSKTNSIALFIAILTGMIIVFLTQNISYALSYFGAVLLHMALSLFDDIFSANGVKSGFMGFLYLEVLDASFSFDGVIGAFAMSENIFIIMIGLGIGAMFVRSLTIYMVHKKTLESFIYLEHGAHYAILVLAIIMFINVFHEVGEAITGTIGFGLIVIAFLSSIYKNKKITNG
ncbi:DUF475 domain-containing protein [Campylobacter fetus]|uniref:DUF475 domain-containing protein n=1 Tax=Campylobacter fetus TaxID=196 RepID=UPI0005090A97|nr:DUF475 domain-containing protein [Campylobacter fetus]WKW17398.1 DUF475 domain-containing protein [Campylobacter fetus subsp. fetus]AIR77978.1 hypothetical membrane protein (DUF475 domain) [Campylobacter fetus subsp. fetus 04/554]EAJ5693848.1 DUF475 domain-containing protein [Campylobacter fetus]EAJ5704174.1 DUF475 domain-containing protein [Campylobacter fetus]EAJ9256990.1 DUF475 domain-containing protein [Campylobacter fetus]